MNGFDNGAANNLQQVKYKLRHVHGFESSSKSYKETKDVEKKSKDNVHSMNVASNGFSSWSYASNSSSTQNYNNYGSLPSSTSSKGDKSQRHDKKYGRSNAGVSGNKQPPRSMKSNSLHRSNSSLNLDRAEEVLGNVIHREYGSASSIDIISSNKDSFFSMLHDYVNHNQDQRSPGPAKIHDYLRGKLDHAPSTENASNTLTNGVTSLDDISSPKLKSKIQKFLEMKEKGKLKQKISTEPSIFRKLSRSATTKNDGDPTSKEISNSVVFNAEVQSLDKIRKKAFIHYDCQSITSHLDGKNIQNILSRRRNTTTGASAASSLTKSAEDISSDNVDVGDDRENDLVLSCPFFRNEIGGEGERIISLTKSTPNQRERDGTICYTLHKPSMSKGISILENHKWGSRTCPSQRPSIMIEDTDLGANYYRMFFKGRDHQNWFGVDDNLGPVAVSIKREKISEDINSSNLSSKSKPIHSTFMYRIIIRSSELAVLRGSVLEDSIPSIHKQTSSRGVQPKEILNFIAPELKLDCFKLGLSDTSTEEELVKLDEQSLTNRHKVGIMYCKSGQSSEEEMYNNENSGPAFNEFLEMLGNRVRLKGFDKYRAGLDVKSDSTGLYSIYASYHSCEVMFHVSTMLPFTPNNKQQLSRKSRIGNDIVTIVFQEPGSLPFTPKNIRSHFQHVFIIVRAINPCTENTKYKISVSRSKDVPVFGPAIPSHATFPKSKSFAEFLLAKVINAENAAYRSSKFVTMATKTRQGYLKDLASHHVSSTTIESAPKVVLFGGNKKREKSAAKIILDKCVKGAVAWNILVEDYGLGVSLHCYVGISNDTIVVLEERTFEKIFVCPCASIMGWTTFVDSIRIYYHQGECLVIRSNDPEDIKELIARLGNVTQGCETQEVTLKRNNLGQLGFHVQHEGIVTEVEHYGLAWQAGLRQSSRIVEICKVAVPTMSHDQMVDLLKTSVVVTVTIIPPLKDNIPRRGCHNRNCNYSVLGDIGDYENVCLSDSDESPMKYNGNAGHQTPHSRYRAHSHGRVGGRKLENQMKNLKMLSKSGYNACGPVNKDSELKNQSKEEKGICDSPPPIPMRIVHSNASAVTPVKYNEVRPNIPPVHFNKPAPFPVPGTKTQRPSSPPSYHHHQIRHANSVPSSVLSSSGISSKYHSNPANQHQGHSWNNSNLPSDVDSPIQRIATSSSVNSGAASSGDDLPLSRGSSPGVRKDHDQPKSKSCYSNKSNSKFQSESGILSEFKSAKIKNNTMLSNSSTLSSQSSGSSSTFHEDLLRLIDPDLIDSQTDVYAEQIPQWENKHKQTVEELLQEMETTSTSVNNNDNSGVICTTALPAQVISSASPSPSDYKMSKEERLSPRVKTSPIHKGKQGNSGSESIIPLPIPDNEQIDWRSLVDTATKAMQVVKKSSSDVNSDSSSSKDVATNCESDANVENIEILKNKVRQLEQELSKEQRKNETLEFEVHQLKEENIKLQEESQAAADQLRRFTEWFFQAIDKQ